MANQSKHFFPEERPADVALQASAFLLVALSEMTFPTDDAGRFVDHSIEENAKMFLENILHAQYAAVKQLADMKGEEARKVEE